MNTMTLKFCCCCKKERPISDFWKDSSKPDGHDYKCSQCKKLGNRNPESRKRGAARQKKHRANNPEKYEMEMAYHRAWSKNNLDKCAVSNRQWKERNPEKHWTSSRNSGLKTKYGITILEAFTIIETQCGLCPICLSDLSEKWVVDHCHKTGKIRGILCGTCNVGIGMLRDSKENMCRAIEYLS